MSFDFEFGGSNLENVVGPPQMLKAEIQQHVYPFRPVRACTAEGFFLIVHLELEALPNTSKLRKCRWKFILEQRKAIFHSTYPIVDLSPWCACTCIRDFGASGDQVFYQFQQLRVGLAGHRVSTPRLAAPIGHSVNQNSIRPTPSSDGEHLWQWHVWASSRGESW